MLQRFDEISNIETALREIDLEAKTQGLKPQIDPSKCEDDILDILIIAWVMGNSDANEALGDRIRVDTDAMRRSIYRRIEGRDFADRMREHIDDGDIEALITLIETETAHAYNDGVYVTGINSGRPLMKKWNTQLDDRVRDTHDYLEGMTIPIDAEFYTYDGDHAPYPSQFESASNNVNCRCYITLSAV